MRVVPWARGSNNSFHPPPFAPLCAAISCLRPSHAKSSIRNQHEKAFRNTRRLTAQAANQMAMLTDLFNGKANQGSDHAEVALVGIAGWNEVGHLERNCHRFAREDTGGDFARVTARSR